MVKWCWLLSVRTTGRRWSSKRSKVVPPVTSRTGLPPGSSTVWSPLSNFQFATQKPAYEMTKCWPLLSTPAVGRPCPSNWSNVVIHNLTNQLAVRAVYPRVAVVEPRGSIPRRVVRDIDWSRTNEASLPPPRPAVTKNWAAVASESAGGSLFGRYTATSQWVVPAPGGNHQTADWPWSALRASPLIGIASKVPWQLDLALGVT